MSIKVTKASGEIVDFDEERVLRSLHYAHVPDDLAKQALAHVKAKLTDKISTHLIYAYIHGFLRHHEPINYSFNYDLKRAIMRLGPTGYPFEKFVAKALSAKGYQTQVGVILNGKCVSHEVDIEASNKKEHYFIECKFHNQSGVKTDIQVALYVQARFEDIKSSPDLAAHHENHRPWLVTNTAVTREVLDYAACVDMRIVSWGFPHDGTLRDLIISTHLHPITVLQNLAPNQLISLFDRGIVTLDELKTFLTAGELPQNIPQKTAEDLLSEIKNFV